MPVRCEAMPVSIVFFFLCSAATLVVGALAWSRTSSLFLPLPAWLPAGATLLSPVTVFALLMANLFLPKALNRYTATVPENRQQRIVSVIDQLQSILSTIIATVAVTYLYPDNILSCHIDQQWQSYFQTRNSHAIRTIQDSLQCCGLRSTRDRAWPFKDRNHGDNACELQLGYQRSCFEPWRAQQRVASWMVFTAAVLIWAGKIGFMRFSRRGPSWMSTFAASSRDRANYQRITHRGEAEEEGEENTDEQPRDPERTMLPQAGPAYSNEWEER